MANTDQTRAVVRAIDVGYGNTKYVSHHQYGSEVECSLFPSIAPHASVGADLSSGVFQRRNTVVVDVNGVNYEVGKDARLAQDASYGRILDPAFSLTDSYMALVRGALFYMGQEEIDMLVVGLPVNTHDQYESELSKRLRGQHRIPKVVRNADQVLVPSAASVTVNVKDVRVVPQPIGAFFDYAISKNIYGRMRGEMNLIIDPGFYTLDWIVAHGVKVNNARSSAHPGGMSAILAAMAESIGKKLGAQISDVTTIDEALKNGTKPRFFGKEMDISEEIKLGKEKARQFVNVLANKVGNKGVDIDNIVIAGGGAHFFRDVIAEKFPNHHLEIVREPVFSNVRGFQLAGTQFVNQDSFSKRNPGK